MKCPRCGDTASPSGGVVRCWDWRCDCTAGPVETLRAEAERIARVRVARGETGADIHAHLLDALDLSRRGDLGSAGGSYEQWRRESGFVDGPEVVS